MSKFVIKLETGKINLTPHLFKREAEDYFECFLQFKPKHFSVVPFALCCRALELAFKAIHARENSRKELKSKYSHDLIKSYADLPREKKILSAKELEILVLASEIYSSKEKEFDYIQVSDSATAYSRYPILDDLSQLTEKVIESMRLDWV